jgi:hypothetical protein
MIDGLEVILEGGPERSLSFKNIILIIKFLYVHIYLHSVQKKRDYSSISLFRG